MCCRPRWCNTVLLLAGVAVVTIVIGVGTAWAVTTFEFPGRDALAWLLPLPLAIPTYIVAYVYVDLLDALGPGAVGAARAVRLADRPPTTGSRACARSAARSW